MWQKGGARTFVLTRRTQDVTYSKRRIRTVAKRWLTLARLRLDPINKLGFSSSCRSPSIGATAWERLLYAFKSADRWKISETCQDWARDRREGRKVHVVHRSSWYQDRQWLSPKLSLIRPTSTETILSQKSFLWNGIQKAEKPQQDLCMLRVVDGWHHEQ